MSYRDELKDYYRKGGNGWNLNQWLNHIEDGNLSHADVMGLLAERDKLRAAIEDLHEPIADLINYRNQNPLNFQLEKADNFLQEIIVAFREIIQIPRIHKTKQDLWKDLTSALDYEKEYSAKTNHELVDALIQGPWANTFLFTRFSTLIDEVVNRLDGDGDK